MLSTKEARRLAKTLATLRREREEYFKGNSFAHGLEYAATDRAITALVAYLSSAKNYGDDAGAAHAWQLDAESPVAPDNQPTPAKPAEL